LEAAAAAHRRQRRERPLRAAGQAAGRRQRVPGQAVSGRRLAVLRRVAPQDVGNGSPSREVSEAAATTWRAASRLTHPGDPVKGLRFVSMRRSTCSQAASPRGTAMADNEPVTKDVEFIERFGRWLGEVFEKL